MKQTLFILLSILILIAGLSYLLVNFVFVDQLPTPSSETATPIISPQPIDTPTPSTKVEIPEDWTRFYDASLNIEFAHPFNWTPQPAANLQGEAAVYSFDPAVELGTDTVPTDHLKVGIVYFGPDDQREVGYHQAEIISEEEIIVDGYPAVRRIVEGLLGRSIDTEVNTDNGTYLISAYPAESDLIGVYDQILEYIRLESEPEIIVNQPGLGAVISSPVVVNGQAPGTWFFEAVLPMSIETAAGEVLAEEIFVTDQDWMTEELIDFSLDIEFDTADTNLGSLKIIKNDVSDIPRNKNFFYLPVRFQPL